MASPARESDLPVDRLPPGAASPVEVLLLEDATFGADAQGAREPHRHGCHELFWTRAGAWRHLIDGRPWPVEPGTVTPDLTVGEIAFRTGFGDPLYFLRAFRRHYGAAPVAYRARIRGAAEGMGAVT